MRISPSTLFWRAQLAPSVGISYKVVVRPRLTPKKCLKDVQGVMLKVLLGGLLEDLPGESRGTKYMKIGIVSERKNNPALKKGHIKHTGQCREFQGMDNLTSEMRNLSICTGW